MQSDGEDRGNCRYEKDYSFSDAIKITGATSEAVGKWIASGLIKPKRKKTGEQIVFDYANILEIMFIVHFYVAGFKIDAITNIIKLYDYDGGFRNKLMAGHSLNGLFLPFKSTDAASQIRLFNRKKRAA